MERQLVSSVYILYLQIDEGGGPPSQVPALTGRGDGEMGALAIGSVVLRCLLFIIPCAYAGRPALCAIYR
jgi:hypothetical protein